MQAESPPPPRQAAEAVLLDGRQRAKLLAYARARFGIPLEDAEDLLQDTALDLLRQQGLVRSAAGFVFAAFRARGGWFLARRRLRREVFSGELEPLGDSSPTATPDALDRRLAIREALQAISSSCRRLLAAYYIEGRSLAEAARILALASSGVAKTINRCLRRLRECLG